MVGPAGWSRSRSCISSHFMAKGWTGRLGSGGKSGRQLSEVYSKTPTGEFVNMAALVKYQLRQCANTAESSGV